MTQFATFLGRHIRGNPPRVVNVSGTEIIRQVKVEGVRAREAITLLWKGVVPDDLDAGAPALARKVDRALTAMKWRPRTELLIAGDCSPMR
jgi:hypothetical protein